MSRVEATSVVTDSAGEVLTGPPVTSLDASPLYEVGTGGITIVVDPGMMTDTPYPGGTNGMYAENGSMSGAEEELGLMV